METNQICACQQSICPYLAQMDMLRALGTFVRIVETGSFSAAAREAGISHSGITRLIGQLEDHFGARLFQRTTRRLNLTVDGEDLLQHARHMLAASEDMEAALGRNRASPAGLVRVGVPVGMGAPIAKTVGALMRKHPKLSIELVVGDGFDDLVRDRLDLAIRVGETADSSLIARAVATYGRVLVAAPDYLERHGAPSQPMDILNHACVVHQAGPTAAIWPFTGPDGATEVLVHPVFSANNSDVIRFAALNGVGIALVSEPIVADDIALGRLHRLLPDYSSGRRQAFVVYPSRRYLAQRTRVVIDFMVEQMRALDARFTAAQTLGMGGSAWLT